MRTARFQIIGHRGAMGHAPENTIRGVRLGMELGADGVEVDVRDVGEHAVILHDATLDRTTNGRGTLANQSPTQLRALDAGDGHPLPTPEEIIGAVGAKGLINFELKSKGAAPLVLAAIRKHVRLGTCSPDQFLLSSFDHEWLEGPAGAGIAVGVLFKKGAWQQCRTSALRLKATSVHPPAKAVTRAIIDEAHTRHWMVLAYTVNDPVEAKRLRDLGLDGVFTDYPDRLVAARQTWEAQAGR